MHRSAIARRFAAGARAAASFAAVALVAFMLRDNSPALAGSVGPAGRTALADGPRANDVPSFPGASLQAREPVLWDQVCAVQAGVRATASAGDAFAAGIETRTTLLALVESYLNLYPGGPRRDEAIETELETLFELETLRNTNLETLRRRVAEYLRAPPSRRAACEAAYWEILCERVAQTKPAAQPEPAAQPGPTTQADSAGAPLASSQPAAARALSLAPPPLAAYERYVEQYPDSRHTPRFVEALFDDADRRGAHDQQRALLALLRKHFADHPMLERLSQRLHAATTGDSSAGSDEDVPTPAAQPATPASRPGTAGR